jgi:hypothetical protein
MNFTGNFKRWAGIIGNFFSNTFFGRAIVFISLPLALLVVAFWETEQEPPIFDAQVHYNQESWERVSVEAILSTSKSKNVPWLLVGSLPNEGTQRLYRGNPDRVIPMMVPYRTREERDTWFNDPKTLPYIESELGFLPYRGIGEFFLFSSQMDTPVVRGMVELAQNRRLVLHARSDPNAIRQLFELGPDLRILWAHAGMFTPPGVVGELLGRYPRLWVDLSLREDVAPRGKLNPDWREVILRHPDRFLLGSGTYTTEYWYQFRYYFDKFRVWLKDLPVGPAEQIAFRNGLELFGVPYREPTRAKSQENK